ncbi:hypothetical protein GCM10025762_20610 [Haloechinothrix salitolerans]
MSGFHVYRAHVLTLLQKSFDQVASDEAASSGDKDGAWFIDHRNSLNVTVRSGAEGVVIVASLVDSAQVNDD